LISLTDKWLQALDQGRIIGSVFVDFRKAFDMVDHEILLKKLKIYQCDESTVRWFTSYLSERTQHVYINNVLSEPGTIRCGVPQGSILGPLLFILFINDLPLVLRDSISSTDLYADDTTLSDIQNTKHELEISLQNALNKLDNWCTCNGMVVNTGKTKILLISTRKKRTKLDSDELCLTWKDKRLQMVCHDSLLGVLVDNNLSWTEHIKHISKKVNSSLWLLSRIRHFLLERHRKLFYNSYIQPYLDYCNTVWGNSNDKNLAKLAHLQKRAFELISIQKESKENLAGKLKILPIKDRICLRKAKLMYRISNNSAPEYLQSLFQYRLPGNTPHLRSMSTKHYKIPKPNKELFKKSFQYSGTLLWNSIPVEIRNAHSISFFQTQYIQWLQRCS